MNAAKRIAGALAVGVAMAVWGAGCASPGKYWYETRYLDVRPSGRTLENGPYQLVCRGHATLALWNAGPGQCPTDEIREAVAKWLEMPPEDVGMAHFAWWLHRKTIANYGSQYSVTYSELMPGTCFITSTPFADIQRQLYNWLTWKKESLYKGGNRRKLRFAYFTVFRDLDEAQQTPEGSIPPDAEYWVCLFDKDGNVLKTARSRALDQERVVQLRVPGAETGKRTADVRIGEETVPMWNPVAREEADQLVVGGLLVEALNAMSEEELMLLEPED